MIVAGFGFRRAATAESLRSALDRAAYGIRIDALAAPGGKAGSGCLTALAAELRLPIRGIAPAALTAAPTATRSDRVAALCGTGSVAEAAALVAAGAGARLLGPRQVSGDRLATCAIAVGPSA